MQFNLLIKLKSYQKKIVYFNLDTPMKVKLQTVTENSRINYLYICSSVHNKLYTIKRINYAFNENSLQKMQYLKMWVFII